MISETISHYRILQKLGAGGMGEVYLAEDTTLGRRVALKLLPASTVADEQAKKRLLREARAAATLDHPNICAIYEVGEADGQSFIVMQYVEGETLAARIKRGRLDLPAALAIAAQVAEALAEAHGRGIIHRDIKPQNIMLTSRGQVKVLDFGLAKIMREKAVAESEAETASHLTEAGAVVGTVLYMSPEQVRAEELDGRSDIFSFGVVLYEMVSGQQPFAAPSMAEIFSAILTREPPSLQQAIANMPAELERIVRKCLAKDRERRYQTMRDLAIDLEQVRRECEAGRSRRSDGEQAAASGAAAATDQSIGPRGTLASSLTTSLRSGWALTLIAVVLIMAGFGYWQFWRGTPAQPESTIKSLAVLPLKSLNREAGDDYLGLGIADAIITKTSQMGALVVRPINAVRRYRDQDGDPLEFARQLQVDSVLDGTVQRVGDHLRVSMTLLRVQDSRSLWNDTFDREMTNAFALQDDISLNVVKALRLTLTASEEKQLAQPPTKNAEAYNYYLRGRFYLNKDGKENLTSAITMFERATALDPTFTLAYVGIAAACNGIFFNIEADKRLEEKAYVAIETALSLDPNLAEARVWRGSLMWTLSNGFPHERTVKEWRKALEINPNLADAHARLGGLYMHIGLLDKGLEEFMTALRLDPTTEQFVLPRLARIHWYQQKYAEALAEFEKLNLPGWRREQAIVLWHLGRADEALALIEKVLKDPPASFSATDYADAASTYALLLAGTGQKQKAETYIRLAQRKGEGVSHFHHAEYFIACAYALMGKNQLAIEWLQKVAEHGMPCYPLFEKEPALDSLRNDPQFMAFMGKLKKQWEGYLATL